jgi:hypothetical protein
MAWMERRERSARRVGIAAARTGLATCTLAAAAPARVRAQAEGELALVLSHAKES